MQLAHAGDDDLSGVLVGVRLEGRVLFLKFEDRGVHALLARLGLGLDSHFDDRLREHHVLQHDLMGLVAQSVARGALLEPDESHDVAGSRLGQILTLVGVHPEYSAYALVLVLAGVVNHHPRLDRPAVYADERELADVFVGQDLEHQRRKRLVVAGMAHFVAVHFGILARDGRNVRGCGQEVHYGVEQTLNALVAVGTAAQHGRHRHLDRPFSDRLLELVLCDGPAFVHDALLEDGVVEIRRLFHQLPARVRSRVLHIGRYLLRLNGDTVVVGGIVERLHGDEVYYTSEIALAAYGEHDGHRVGVQSVVHHFDRIVKVRSVDVHFVDESDAGHLVGVGLTPHVLGLRFHAAFGAEHRDRSVQHSQAALDFNGKVDVSGSVDDVDLMTFPHGGSSSGSDGDPPFSLLLHVIHNRCAVVHLAEFARHARIEQDALGRCGLAGVDVSHDADIPDLVKCKVALHKDYHL